jgi:peptidoglycan L-alanyl-D-glutamate endopeptidase CwlK
MPKFSKRSQDRLNTCHPLLRKVFEEVVKKVDCTIIEGVRTVETQKEYVRTGKSTTMNSKHLPQADGTSWAVDCIAYPVEWDNWQRNYMFAGYVKGVAHSMGIDLRMGADWDGDFTTKDQKFHDLPHFELRSDKVDREAGVSSDKELLPSGPSESDINVTLDELEKELDL